MDKPSISFYTLGCRLNQSETAVIESTFKNKGFKIIGGDEASDIAVINTCTVTEKGDADTRKLINRINRQNPKVKIALIGCQAQIQKEKLTELPNVEWVVGTEKKMDLISIIGKASGQLSHPQVIVPSITDGVFKNPAVGIYRSRTRANLKVQDGCDFFCSFCEIPYARGRARSREFNDIILEAKALAAAGHKEIIVTGINVGMYRQDGKTLLDVIDALEQIKDLKRIRVSSVEPTTVAAGLLKKMGKSAKLCRYLHLPLQSANDEILKTMNRKYNFADYKNFIETAVDTVAQICIGTDLLVGFPGEEERHFRDTYEKVSGLSLSYFHVFSYSERTLAKSKHLPQKVSIKEIAKRSAALRNLGQKKRKHFYQSLLGSRQKVLFEQKKGDLLFGLTDNYAKVGVKTGNNFKNQIKEVVLSENKGQYLAGEIIE